MTRPILKIPLNPVDWIIEGVTLFMLMGIIVYTAIHYSILPETIPTHYGFSGKTDGSGGKSTLLVLIGVVCVIYVFLTGINRKPHWFNYPNQITESNAPRLYSIAIQMIRVLKLIVVVIFSYIILTTIQISQGNLTSLGTWFIPTALFSFLALIIISAIRSSLKS